MQLKAKLVLAITGLVFLVSAVLSMVYIREMLHAATGCAASIRRTTCRVFGSMSRIRPWSSSGWSSPISRPVATSQRPSGVYLSESNVIGPPPGAVSRMTSAR